MGEHIPLLEKEGWMRGQKKYREATLLRADGVVRPAECLGLTTFAELTPRLRCFSGCAKFYLCRSHPLLFKEGKRLFSQRST
jgi:hypothetical protein